MEDREGDKVWTAVNRDVWMWKGTDQHEDRLKMKVWRPNWCSRAWWIRQTGKYCDRQAHFHAVWQRTDRSRVQRGAGHQCVPSLLYFIYIPKFRFLSFCCSTISYWFAFVFEMTFLFLNYDLWLCMFISYERTNDCVLKKSRVNAGFVSCLFEI